MIDNEEFDRRNNALSISGKYLEPIFEKFPPETYSNNVSPTPAFTAPVKSTTTQADQVVNLMITLADWLVKTE